jgi:hypothetical protein
MPKDCPSNTGVDLTIGDAVVDWQPSLGSVAHGLSSDVC